MSAYLRNFVVARINPLRFRRGAKMLIGEALQRPLEPLSASIPVGAVRPPWGRWVNNGVLAWR